MARRDNKYLDEDVDRVFADRPVKRFLKGLRKHAESGDLEQFIQKNLPKMHELSMRWAADTAQGDMITGIVGHALANRFINGDFEIRLAVNTICHKCEGSDDPEVRSKSIKSRRRKVKDYVPSFEFYADLPTTLSKLRIDPNCGHCGTPLKIASFANYLIPVREDYGQVIKFIVMRQKTITRAAQKFVRVAFKDADMDIGDNNGITIVANYQGRHAPRKFRNYFEKQRFGPGGEQIDLDHIAQGTEEYDLLTKHDVIPASYRVGGMVGKRKKTPMRDAALYGIMLAHLINVADPEEAYQYPDFWAPFTVRDHIDDYLFEPKERPTGTGVEEFRMLKSYLQVDRGKVLTPQDLENIYHRISEAKGWNEEDLMDVATNFGSVTIEVRVEDIDNWEKSHDPAKQGIDHRTYELRAGELFEGLKVREPGAAEMHRVLSQIGGM
ncbi:hypothetical protein KY362_01905 [Candidatus Woesearchaeota archaeon]|nr:hypothetical protein [Candidatus Woesearchaeota archaeon]